MTLVKLCGWWSQYGSISKPYHPFGEHLWELCQYCECTEQREICAKHSCLSEQTSCNTLWLLLPPGTNGTTDLQSKFLKITFSPVWQFEKVNKWLKENDKIFLSINRRCKDESWEFFIKNQKMMSSKWECKQVGTLRKEITLFTPRETVIAGSLRKHEDSRCSWGREAFRYLVHNCTKGGKLQ